MEQIIIPEFMREDYHQADAEGRHKIERLAFHYGEERAVFLQSVFVAKQQFLRDWNKFTGQKKQLTANEALAPMRQKYAEQVKQAMKETKVEKLEKE